MSLFFSFLDLLLICIMLFDTLGLIYLFRTNSKVEPKEYIRICFSWIFFLTIFNLFYCNWRGFLGTFIRLLLFAAKAYVTIPIFRGTLKLHNYLIEKKKVNEFINKITGIINSKLCKNYQNNDINSFKTPSENTEQESIPGNTGTSNNQ